MVIGTSLGWSDWETIGLAVALAFFFGYSFTMVPLLRGGIAFGAAAPIALAADTVSITIMEIVDNAIMLGIPGAMDAGLGDPLFWGALGIALAIAGVAAFPANRWLIRRGRGHAVMHETGVHGGLPEKPIAVVFAAGALFGAIVLGIEAFDGDSDEPAQGRSGHP
jgi:hypothetical protein